MLGRERGREELLDSFGRWSFGVPSNYSWAPNGGGMPLVFPRVTLCALGIQTCSLVRCGGKKKIKTILVQRELAFQGSLERELAFQRLAFQGRLEHHVGEPVGGEKKKTLSG